MNLKKVRGYVHFCSFYIGKMGTRKKKDDRWTVEDEIEIIQFYKKNRILWDSKNVVADRDQRSSLLAILAEALQNKYTGSFINI